MLPLLFPQAHHHFLCARGCLCTLAMTDDSMVQWVGQSWPASSLNSSKKSVGFGLCVLVTLMHSVLQYGRCFGRERPKNDALLPVMSIFASSKANTFDCLSNSPTWVVFW